MRGRNRAFLFILAVALLLPLGARADAVTFRKLLLAPVTLDTKYMNDVGGLSFSTLVYAGLVRFSPYLEVHGDLAERWETSADGKTVTFHLKEAYFHDGQRVTSTHVVNSFSRLLQHDSRVYSFYECIEGAEQYHRGEASRVLGLQPAGENTLRIRLKHPFPSFLTVLAGATAKIFPVADLRSFKPETFFKKPIGAGPFRTISVGKKQILLERHDRYHGVIPRLEKMALEIISDEEAIERAYQGIIHDLTNDPIPPAHPVFTIGQKVESRLTETWIIGLNTRLAPFNDVRVRRAFKLDVPAETFRKRLYPSAWKAAGYVPPSLPGHLDEIEISKLNARMKKTARRSTHPISITVPKELVSAGDMVVLLQDHMRKLGWNVTFYASPWTELMAGYNGKTLQGFLVSMNMDYPDPEFLFRNFLSTNPDNFSGLEDPQLDQLIEAARSEKDRILRMERYDELGRKIHEHAVTAELLYPRAAFWLDECVRGFEPSQLNASYIDYLKTWLDPECLSRRKRLAAKAGKTAP